MLSGYECSFMIEHLPSLLWALGVILGNTKKTKAPNKLFSINVLKSCLVDVL